MDRTAVNPMIETLSDYYDEYIMNGVSPEMLGAIEGCAGAHGITDPEEITIIARAAFEMITVVRAGQLNDQFKEDIENEI